MIIKSQFNQGIITASHLEIVVKDLPKPQPDLAFKEPIPDGWLLFETVEIRPKVFEWVLVGIEIGDSTLKI